ncbi:hypothetical protein, partial [Nocardia abscessus]|uniref:hypothetical protein n=1 Tax=Nocardia abscessus TaxID=120957 RepID=UPI0024578C87
MECVEEPADVVVAYGGRSPQVIVEIEAESLVDEVLDGVDRDCDAGPPGSGLENADRAVGGGGGGGGAPGRGGGGGGGGPAPPPPGGAPLKPPPAGAGGGGPPPRDQVEAVR